MAELGDISPIENLEEFIHPSKGAILQGDEQGLLQKFREVIDFLREQDGDGHLEQE